MDSPDIVQEASTTETMRTMIREELTTLLPELINGHLTGVARADDIAGLNEKLAAIAQLVGKTATIEDYKRHQDLIVAHTEALAALRKDQDTLVKRVDENEHRDDLFQKFLKDSIVRIELATASATTAMEKRDVEYQRRFENLEDRIKTAEQDSAKQAERIAGNNNDIADLRQRLAETVTPIHSFIAGDETRPPIRKTIEDIQSALQRDSGRIDTLEDFANSIKAAWRTGVGFLRSKAGNVLVGLVATSFFLLFSRIDPTGLFIVIRAIFGEK